MRPRFEDASRRKTDGKFELSFPGTARVINLRRERERGREFIQIAIFPIPETIRGCTRVSVSCRRLRYDSSRLSLVINVTACSVNLASSWFVEGESKLPVITARSTERREREREFV